MKYCAKRAVFNDVAQSTGHTSLQLSELGPREIAARAALTHDTRPQHSIVHH